MLWVETNLRFFLHPPQSLTAENGTTPTGGNSEIPHIMPMKFIPTRWWKTWKKK